MDVSSVEVLRRSDIQAIECASIGTFDGGAAVSYRPRYADLQFGEVV
jgi:hypothetical protein